MLHGNSGQTAFWYQIFVAYTKANLAYNYGAPVRCSKTSSESSDWHHSNSTAWTDMECNITHHILCQI